MLTDFAPLDHRFPQVALVPRYVTTNMAMCLTAEKVAMKMDQWSERAMLQLAPHAPLPRSTVRVHKRSDCRRSWSVFLAHPVMRPQIASKQFVEQCKMNTTNDQSSGRVSAESADCETELQQLNTILRKHAGFPVRWWSYSVLHSTFDIAIGDVTGAGPNVTLCAPYIESACAPVDWKDACLNATRLTTCTDPQRSTLLISDADATIRLRSQTILWATNFDLLHNLSIWFSARRPSRRNFELVCPKCKHVTFIYGKYCQDCGTRLPSESKMFAIGLTRPVTSPDSLLQIGYSSLKNDGF